MRPFVPVLLAAAAACGGHDGGPTGTTTGSLEIKTETTGEIPATDYMYRVDGEPTQTIGSNATVSRPELEAGSHVVQLSGLPDGCTATTENPQTVSITAEATSVVPFGITCVPPVGTIQVVTATSGPAPASYEVVIDAASVGPIGASETRSIESIPSGVHSIGLSALPANCQPAGENPQATTLQTGETATVSFAVTCTAPTVETGTLRVTTATTGVDPDGYRLVIDEGTRQPIGVNGALVLANLPTGNHVVRLAGLATGCTPAGQNPRLVSMTAGSTATVGFTVTCAPPPAGSLRLTTSTTGTNLDADGYVFSVDGGPAQQIAANGAVTLENVAVGSRNVALSGIAEGCVLDGSNPRPADVTSGAVAELVFAIRCAPMTNTQWNRMESGTTFSLYSVWGSSASDIFSVGEPGGRFEAGIFHYDGQAWAQQSTQAGVTLYSIWGSGSNDVFAVGSSPLGERGFDGVILHYDGASWTPMEGPGIGTEDGSVQANFFSVWGTSGTDVFAVGGSNAGFNRAIIAHYDGVSWAAMPLLNADDRVLKDVYGSSPQDIYAVGYFDASADLRRGSPLLARAGLFSEGVILHYDGTAWSESQPVGSNIAYNAVWASGPNDVFVVGAVDDSGIILRADGTGWSTMPSPPTGPLLDVWGTSGSDVYAVGIGTILHYDGQSWTENLASPHRLSSVWTSSPTQVFTVGNSGTILNGSAILAASGRP